MTEFRAFHNSTQETELFDVEVNKSANPFGDYAILYIDDSSGSRFDDYPRGTKITVEEKDFSEANSAFSEYFVGFVVERREGNRASGDVLEVEAYSFDQFLRRNTVSSDQSGNTISTALDNVITDDTPVTFVSGNVDLINDKTLNRGYEGENVEAFLRSVSNKSGSEDWGVNSSLEFFMRPNENATAPRNIDNTEWLDYDIPERGKRSVNEVTVFFDSGTQAITLQDAGDQLELKNQLGASDGITLFEEVSRPDITNRGAAIDVAERILSEKSPTLTGTVTTFGIQTADPGDVIGVTIDPRGIDDEFRIAENLTKWAPDTNQLTIVRKQGNQDDLLVNLARDTKRVEMKDVDRTVTKDLIIPASTGVTFDTTSSTVVTGTDGPESFNDSVMTNTGLSLIRDEWLDVSFDAFDVDQMVVGTGDVGDPSPVSREDTALDNQTESQSVTITRPTNTTVDYSADNFDNLVNTGGFTDVPLVEMGLTDGSGNLLYRAIFDSLSGNSLDIDLRITVNNDDSIARGVVTNDGQTVFGDIIGATTPDLPVDYGVGDGTSAVSESDTSLSNATTQSIDNTIPNGLRSGILETDFGTALTNTTIAESGAFDTNGNLLTRARFQSRTVDSNQNVVTRETNTFENA